MKKLIINIIFIVICFTFIGCSNTDNVVSNSNNNVFINLPNDDSVNGYRNNNNYDNEENTMPDIIKGEDVEVENESNTDKKTATSSTINSVNLFENESNTSKNNVSLNSNESKNNKTSSNTIDNNKINSNNNTNESKIEKYCANKNSKVFHKPDCGSVKSMKDENKYYATKEELLSENYKACGRCHP